eukprot:4068773-Prymnesium_polylepis.1
MPDDTLLLFWRGRSHFAHLAVNIELHAYLGDERTPNQAAVVNDDSFLLRHSRQQEMYVQPRVCSATSGMATCASGDLSSIPEGTALIFSRTGEASNSTLARMRFNFLFNPFESSYVGMGANADLQGSSFILQLSTLDLIIAPKAGGYAGISNGQELVL